MRGDELRRHSLSVARRLGYSQANHLPELDEEVIARSVDELTGRMLALYASVACAYGFAKPKARAWLAREGLDVYVTPAERLFLTNGMALASAIRDQVEALWALAWAAGIAPELDFGQPCPDHFVQMLPDLKRAETALTIRKRITYRTVAVLLQALDTAYCLHWSIRQAELEGKRPPGKVAPYVIVERRRALEWLLSHQEWDEVTLDT